MKDLRKKLKQNREDGFTLVELIVAVVLFGLLTTLVFNLFSTTRDTTENVQSGSVSVAEAQTATGDLAKKVRNAAKMKVSDDGSRLDLENSDGTCSTWVYYSGALYYSAETGADFEESWFKRLPQATLTESGRFFTDIIDGVSYAFRSGVGVGAKSITGESYMRLPATSETSVCFGDAPEPGEEPEVPVVTPTPPPVVNYNIGYNLNGGTVSGNPTTYASNGSAFTLNNPTRSGYTFTGWTGTGVDTPSTNVTIPAGAIGDRTFEAIWAVIPAPTPTPTPTPTPPPASSIPLSGSYNITQSWNGGANAEFVIKSSAAYSGDWKVTFPVPAGTTISWGNLNCSVSGTTATCTPLSWNKNFNANETKNIGFGFNGNGIPTSVTLTFSK